MLYASIDRTKLTAGLQSNTYITDALVNSKINHAKAVIDGVIGDVYQLPLPAFYQNTITFAGTASGDDTMTISIDGVEYAISIVTSDTAAMVADKFRQAVLDDDSSTFVIDDMLDDEVVYIISNNTGDKTEVQITSIDPQTVEGITATGGSVVATAHALIRQIAEEIAAALLLQIAYGKESENTDKEGYIRYSQAIKFLKTIQDKKVKLRDGDGSEFPVSTDARMSFSPNDTTNTGDGGEDDTSARFSVNQVF